MENQIKLTSTRETAEWHGTKGTVLFHRDGPGHCISYPFPVLQVAQGGVLHHAYSGNYSNMGPGDHIHIPV